MADDGMNTSDFSECVRELRQAVEYQKRIRGCENPTTRELAYSSQVLADTAEKLIEVLKSPRDDLCGELARQRMLLLVVVADCINRSQDIGLSANEMLTALAAFHAGGKSSPIDLLGGGWIAASGGLSVKELRTNWSKSQQELQAQYGLVGQLRDEIAKLRASPSESFLKS
jgi:hypothetical protein